jgi:hypothetical protein
MPELPSVGDEFAGYRLRAVLGRGGMSVVFQADNPRLGNVIALKVLAPELASDDVFRTRFLEESRIAASMNHPNVIPIHDMGSSNGLLYIAMRWVSGTDLRQMIKKRGRLQPEAAVFLLSQAARALDAGHARGLVHRDVKPGNLLIENGNDDADPDHLYLADFGITKRGMTRTGLTSTGQFLGTVDYVAPEQIRGLPALGTADQYSLGCVLYECLTGQVPFEKDLDAAIIWAHVEEPPTRPTLLRPDLPPAMDEVFGRVLAKQPDDRYGDCREFMAAARAALAGGAGLAAVTALFPATAPPPAAAVYTLRPVPPPTDSATTGPAAKGPATAEADGAAATAADLRRVGSPGNAAALLAWYAAPTVPPDYPWKTARADDLAQTSSGRPAEPALIAYPADPEPPDYPAKTVRADHVAGTTDGYPETAPADHLTETAIGYPADGERIYFSTNAAPADHAARAAGDYWAEPEPLDYPAEFAAADYPPTLARADHPAATVGGYQADPRPVRFPAEVAPAVADGYRSESGPSGYLDEVAPDDYAATGYPPETGIGYPAEVTHDLTEPPDVPFARAQFARSPQNGTTLPHRRQAAAAPPGRASDSDDWPPRREPPRRGRGRFRRLGIVAAVLLLVGASGAAYAAMHGGNGAKPKPGVPTTRPLAGSPAASAMAKGMGSPQAKTSTLMTVLTQADHSSIATGLVPPSSCKQQSATLVTCTNPAPPIATATFTTYPTLTAMYAAYETTVKSLTAGQFKENFNDCGPGATSPFGEVAWNHDEAHPRTYTVAQMAAGTVPFASAAGRVACVATAHGSEDFVWTTDIGNMLGVAIGKGSALSVWNWWIPVHHWILFPGTPSMASMNSCSALMHAATGCSMPASSMPASQQPTSGSSMGATPSKSPSMTNSSSMSP